MKITTEELKANPHLLLSNKKIFQEAATTADFPILLRDGIKSIMFDSFAGMKTTYENLVDKVPSDRDEEVWTELERGGTIPIVPEQTAFPTAKYGMLPPKRIKNYKRGLILNFSDEILRFDRTNQIRQWASDFGRQVAHTREQHLYSVLTDTSNYQQTADTNDVGPNTGSTQFNSEGFNEGWVTLTTMKDRASGRYLGIVPDTLIVTPLLYPYASQFLGSMVNNTQTRNVNPDRTQLGQGNMNPWSGMISNLVMSPFLGTGYQWVLTEAKRSVKWQVVEDMTIMFQGADNMSDAFFEYDSVRYRVRDWWGMGMYDDRFTYYSSSTT